MPSERGEEEEERAAAAAAAAAAATTTVVVVVVVVVARAGSAAAGHVVVLPFELPGRTCAAARGGGHKTRKRVSKRLITETREKERRRRPGALRAPWNHAPMRGKGWGTLAALLARV